MIQIIKPLPNYQLLIKFNINFNKINDFHW